MCDLAALFVQGKPPPFFLRQLFGVARSLILSSRPTTLVADLKAAARNDRVGGHRTAGEARVREEGPAGEVVIADDVALAGHEGGRGAVGRLHDLDAVLGQQLVGDGGDALGHRLRRVCAERVDQRLVLELQRRDVCLHRVRAAVTDADRAALALLLVRGIEAAGDGREDDNGVLALLGRGLQTAGDGRQESEGRRRRAAPTGEPDDRVGLGVSRVYRLGRLGDGGRGG